MIKEVYWSKDSYDMVFITNNPIGSEVSDSRRNMPFLKRRRLEGARRMLPGSSVDLNYNFKIKLTEEAIHDVLPNLGHLGDLYLDYPLEDPEFYKSCLENVQYYHFIFGLIVTILLFLAYLIKVCCVMPSTKNRGQIIAHIFALKCGGLALYPTYG